MTNKEQKSFVIYTEYRELIELLSIADRGRLFTAMMEYCTTGEVSIKLSGTVLAVFISIRQTLDRDAEKYRKRCEMNRESGKLGGRPRKSTDENTAASTCTPSEQVSDGEIECADGDESDTEASHTYGRDIDTKGSDGKRDESGADGTHGAASESEIKKAPAKAPGDTIGSYSSGIVSANEVDEDLIESFDRFWKAYPKKKKRSDAWLEWIKLYPSNREADDLIGSVEVFKYSDKWEKENGRYVPAPDYWLRNRCWEHELNLNELMIADYKYKQAHQL